MLFVVAVAIDCQFSVRYRFNSKTAPSSLNAVLKKVMVVIYFDSRQISFYLCIYSLDHVGVILLRCSSLQRQCL